MKNNEFKGDKIEKEVAKKKKEMEKMQEAAAKRRREMEKREIGILKKENDAERSRVASEKLQLNWIKWNITCLGLGFTAYKFYYTRLENHQSPIGHYITGQEIGMFLIALGFITLTFATIQHKKKIHNLKLLMPTMHYSLSLRLSYVILVFSVLVFLVVLLRT
ncbi:MAG TPA: hypothetical protein VK492_14410 [Chitinophagaceae bacterium]|nr:hypothetical protein [Chitinophagaceae bacterium]